jgi:hypothetical protein
MPIGASFRRLIVRPGFNITMYLKRGGFFARSIAVLTDRYPIVVRVGGLGRLQAVLFGGVVPGTIYFDGEA